jgi:hypothetical protein
MACRELLVTLDLPRPAMISILALRERWTSSRDYLLAGTASGLDLHPTSSGRIRDRQSGGTFAHIRTFSGNVVDVALSRDAGLEVRWPMSEVVAPREKMRHVLVVHDNTTKRPS